MDDHELDRLFFEAFVESERVVEDPLANARARAQTASLDCSLQSSEHVYKRLTAASQNSQAVLRVSLGLSGPIEWTTLPVPWVDPAQMENRLGQECLWIPTVLGSYSSETGFGSHAIRAVSARAHLFEHDIQNLLRKQDPAIPLVVQASFSGIVPRDESFIDEMTEMLEARMQFRGRFAVTTEGRNMTVRLPLTDSHGTVCKDVPYDFYEELFDCLEATGKGKNGGLRFSKNIVVVSPRPHKERGLQSGAVQVNRCTLGVPRSLPSSSDVASFFDLSTQQVEAVVRGFFCPPEPLRVPPHTPLDRVMTAK